MLMTVKDKIIRAKGGFIAQTLKRLELIALKDLTESPVLFIGPTGSGKEMLADALVEHIRPKAKIKFPYNKINCVGLPGEIIESELFGHERGSFTGALNDHTGIIEKSAGGVLLLDEIGVLSERLQAKLLRVLEDRKIRKVGSSKWKEIDVRFIAATNRDIIADLKHRFTYKIHIPPLNEIPEEIPSLLKYFLKDAPFRRITVGTLLSMAQMVWEGNVRELKNYLKEAEISFELIKKEPGADVPNSFTKEGLFDIVLLFEMVPIALERYWTIRTFTTFDEVLIEDIPEITKIKMDSIYQFHQARSLWRTEGDSLLMSLRRKAPSALEDEPCFDIKYELCLDIDENFPIKAQRLINGYLDYLDQKTSERLESLVNHPESPVYLNIGLRLGIEPNKRLLQLLKKTPQPETKTPDLFHLPWEQAKENFRKAYWDRVDSDNPGLNKKQIAEKMGISETSYYKTKQKFNEKALKTDKN